MEQAVNCSIVQLMNNLKFLDLVKKRQSVRQYDSRPVEPEKLERCLEAARLAPSASNSQPWKFIVVSDPQLVVQVAKETVGPFSSFNRFAVQAPVIIVISIERMKTFTQVAARLKDREFAFMDLGITAEHFCLQAAEEGLGTCMVGWFNEFSLKKLLKIPVNKRIGLVITLGYPPENYPTRVKGRKTIGEIVSYNSY